jgi:hypothetical protein
MSYNPCPANQSECKAPLNDWLRDRNPMKMCFLSSYYPSLILNPHWWGDCSLALARAGNPLFLSTCQHNMLCCTIHNQMVTFQILVLHKSAVYCTMLDLWQGLKLRPRNFLQQPRPLSVILRCMCECHIKSPWVRQSLDPSWSNTLFGLT